MKAKIFSLTIVFAVMFCCFSVIHAQTADVLLKQVQAAFDKGDYESALKDLNILLGKEPSNAEGLTQRARVHILIGKDAEAFADAEKILSIDPKNVIALNVRGLVKYNKKDYAGAVADYSEAISIDPKFVKAYGNRLRANIRLNAPKDPILYDYLKAKELDPNFSPIYQSIGVWCLQTVTRCREAFEALIRLEPNNEFGYFGRGTQSLAELDRYATNPGRENLNEIIIKDVNTALADFNKAIEINPKTSDSYNNRGRLKYILGDYDEAIADFDKAASLNPKNFQAFMNRGTARRTKKNYDLALKDYAEAEKLQPKSGVLFLEKSLLYREIGEIDLAMTNIGKALYLEPKNDDYVILQAVLLIDQNRYEEAIVKFDSIYKSHLTGGFRWLGRCFESAAQGDAYLKLQNYVEAENRFRSALQHSAGECRERALFGYATVTLLEKRPDIAMETLAELDKLNPKYPGLREKRAEVAAAMPAYNKQQAEWKAKWEAENAEWQRQVQANLAREGNLSGGQRKTSKPVNTKLVGQALTDFDALIARLKELDANYANAAAKLRRAQESDRKNGNVNSVQFYKGTMNRAQSCLDEAHRIIQEYLQKYDSILDDSSKAILEDWDESFPTSIFY